MQFIQDSQLGIIPPTLTELKALMSFLFDVEDTLVTQNTLKPFDILGNTCVNRSLCGLDPLLLTSFEPIQRSFPSSEQVRMCLGIA